MGRALKQGQGPFDPKALHRLYVHEASAAWRSFYHPVFLLQSLQLAPLLHLCMLRYLEAQVLPLLYLHSLPVLSHCLIAWQIINMQGFTKFHLQVRLLSRTSNPYIWLPNTYLHLTIYQTFRVEHLVLHLRLNSSRLPQTCFSCSPTLAIDCIPNLLISQVKKKKEPYLFAFHFTFISNLSSPSLWIQNTPRVWVFLTVSLAFTLVWSTIICHPHHCSSLLTQPLASLPCAPQPVLSKAARMFLSKSNSAEVTSQSPEIASHLFYNKRQVLQMSSKLFHLTSCYTLLSCLTFEISGSCPVQPHSRASLPEPPPHQKSCISPSQWGLCWWISYCNNAWGFIYPHSVPLLLLYVFM